MSTDYKLALPAFSHRAELAYGQPIGRLMAQALKHPEVLSLAAGFVDNASLPCEAVVVNAQRLFKDVDRLRRALQYDSTAGNAPFRSALLDWCYRDYPAARPPLERVIISAGSNQFLHLLAEALLDPGDIVLAAAPTYFVFLGTVRGVGGRVIGVQADQHGLCLDSLEVALEQIRHSGCARQLKAIYTVADFDNPAGSTLSLQRRQRLLNMVAQWREQHGPLLILSDNAYQHLRYSGNALPPLIALHPAADEFVIELGTFSKSFSPGIRVGWGVVPANLVDRLLDIKANVDFGSPHFSQVLMWEALVHGDVDRHLPRIQAAYRVKRDAMLAALQQHLGDIPGVGWRQPDGGLYVWLTLPPQIEASEHGRLWQQAMQSGVLYVPGNYCFPAEGVPVQANSLRLSFGVQSTAGIAEGIARLAQAIRSTLATVSH